MVLKTSFCDIQWSESWSKTFEESIYHGVYVVYDYVSWMKLARNLGLSRKECIMTSLQCDLCSINTSMSVTFLAAGHWSVT